ncbi:MAG: M28 family peptidase [Candidatus Aminicenantes bacterium]|nr:M28 family peptidase [Candidatus Aminicenantes bacterium]
MKKNILISFFVFVLIFSLRAQMPPQQQMKLEDVQKALNLVDKAQPAPDKYKAGLEAITAKDSIAMLTFISSDWMEGRETGTRGYAIAAEYAASLFKLWGVKPAGDLPSFGGGRGMGGARGQGGAPATPPERTYFQEFGLKSTSDVQSSMTLQVAKGSALKTRTFVSGIDYQAMGRGGNPETLSAPVVFVGYGLQEPSIKFDELKGLDLKGKIVLILTEAPGRDNPQSLFQTKKELKEKYFPAAPAGGPQMAFMGPRGGGQPGRFNKLTEIQKLGPAAIFQVQNVGRDSDIYRALSTVRRPNDERPIVNKPRQSLSIPGVVGGGPMGGGASTLTITREMANAILEATGQTIDDLKKKIETTDKQGKIVLTPVSMDLPGTKVTISTIAKTALVRGINVLGVIEGSDPKLKDEYFVVGGHYDHLGAWEDYVYNGADDNGSGSVGVLNIAKAIAASAVKPKRSVVFALWTGEEEGLLGSRYYTLNPIFPLEKTVGYLNYDMISRPFDDTTLARSVRQYNVPGAEELVKKIRAPWFVTVNITDGTPFGDIAREMNQYVGLDLALRGNALGVGSGGSDHASFAGVKLPFIYYMAASTTDYHQTSDSVEKVSGELIAKISKHGFMTVFAYADK